MEATNSVANVCKACGGADWLELECNEMATGSENVTRLPTLHVAETLN